MTDPLASPRAGRLASPSWLDARLVLGVLLVLVSVVVGARVLSAADRSSLVWSASRDLAPGSSLSVDDLRATSVRLFDSGGRYLAATGEPPTGYVLQRGVSRGELLPLDALQRPGAGTPQRLVTVPVLPGHYPPQLARGQSVDVWSTPDDASAAPADPSGEQGAAPTGGSRLVLAGVTVDAPPDVGTGLSGSAERAVVLVVAPDDVGLLVAAMSQGRIDLVGVPGAGEVRGEPTPVSEDR